jgi:hypothetical protein
MNKRDAGAVNGLTEVVQIGSDSFQFGVPLSFEPKRTLS